VVISQVTCRAAGRRAGSALLGALIVGLLSVGVARASSTEYFDNNSCCGTREYAGFEALTTQNSSNNGGGYVVCVQEEVFPSGGGHFFDQYKCAPSSVSHALNGQSFDQALCWINSTPSPLMTCSENYN
jgi:hypothetical protein